MTNPNATVSSLLAAYELARPHDAPTLRTVIKTVALPHWKRSSSDGHRRAAPETIPAEALYGLLSSDQKTWSPAVSEALPSGATYQKAYCRCIKRLIGFGEQSGLLQVDLHLMSPSWRELLALAYGCTAREPQARRAAMRSAFKRLARWATAHGVVPSDVPLESQGSRPMAAFFKTFQADRDGDFYRARTVWNMIVALKPMDGLRSWDGWNNGAIVAQPARTWPAPLQAGLKAIFDHDRLGNWRPETRRGYTQQLGSYLSILNGLGVDVAAVVVGVSEGVDALRLLFQGLPSEAPKMSAAQMAEKVTTSPSFRAELLVAMTSIATHDDGRPSNPNPLLVEAIAKLVESKKVTSAANLVNKALSINRGLLDVTDRHIAWLFRQRTLLNQLAKRQPSTYTVKKRIVFKHPSLWEDLVRARGRLHAHTQDLEARWQAAPVHRTNHIQRRWAIALRNEVLVGLLLCYPLRVKNLVDMRLGLHYNSHAHHIAFEAAETKNDKEIDYELPDGGALGNLRGLVERYLTDARPILLAGRQSDYFFVPDPRGGIKLRSKGVNAILADTSRRFLADILPSGIATLNPHLLRHATASYQLAIRQDLNLAAQLLNDSPATITRAYADVLACKKEATKRFLSGFSLEKGNILNKRRRR